MGKKEVLVIVAHPDDETIWMGGTLLKNKKNWKTTIVSLTRKKDKDRAPKFKKVCREFGAKSYIFDLNDAERGRYKKISHEEIAKKLKRFTKKNWDCIFTHGKNGEYGHIRHKQVHNTVDKMLRDKILSAKRVFFFSYLKKGNRCRPNLKSDKLKYVNDLILERKKDLIHDKYGFDKQSFEFKSGNNKKEAFKIQKIK